MSKIFKVYKDSRNSWLAVKTKTLKLLALDALLEGAPVKGATAYLNESATNMFSASYIAVFGPLVNTVTDHGERSWVRNMPIYTTSKTSGSDEAAIILTGDIATVTPTNVTSMPAKNVTLTTLVEGDLDVVAVEGVTLNLPETNVNLKSDF